MKSNNIEAISKHLKDANKSKKLKELKKFHEFFKIWGNL